jgi:L-alanine-DL-glutamate epimerase-like enolase superfamily enzyme
MERRNFLKTSATFAAASLSIPALGNSFNIINRSKKMVLRYRPFDLLLRHPFTISGFTRTTTQVVLTEIEYDGIVGYGEASMPPYLGETQASVIEFLKKVNLERFASPFMLEDIYTYLDSIAMNNCAAKAAVDIALHDLVGKIMKQPWHKIWGLNPEKAPSTSFTIGIDTNEVVKQKTREDAPLYNLLKVKVGHSQDKEMIEAIRTVTDKPIAVDVNQGWTNKHHALEMIHWLKDKGIVMIEQPMPRYNIDDAAWLTERSPLPIIADESFQRLTDLMRLKGAFDGVNIKLMKCTGMREAWKILNAARSINMQVMVGCMIESSCAVSAAAQISPAVDWADLDGNLLISNDIFRGITVVEGKVILHDHPGVGVTPIPSRTRN